MKSDIITIDNHGNGFMEAVEQTKAFSERCGELSPKTMWQTILIKAQNGMAMNARS